MSAPSGALNTSNLSIKQLMNEERKKSQSIPEKDLPMESFSKDQLIMAWKQFAFKMKDERKDTLYNAMVKRDPVITEGDVIRIEVDNHVQLRYFEKSMQDLTASLREKLKNFRVSVDVILAEGNDQEGGGYESPKDQFARLARKYPNLHSFKSAFNLDFDF